MNDNDKQLLKSTPSMLKGIAVQKAQLNGNQNISVSLKDICGMAEFGFALGGQISEADNVNTTKLISECLIGGVLFGAFIGLLAVNIANRFALKEHITFQCDPLPLPTPDNGALEAKMAELERLYGVNSYFINSKMVSGATVISITAHMPAPISFTLAPSE